MHDGSSIVGRERKLRKVDVGHRSSGSGRDIICKETSWYETSSTLGTLDAAMNSVRCNGVWHTRGSRGCTGITVFETSRVETGPLVDPFNIAWLITQHPRGQSRVIT